MPTFTDKKTGKKSFAMNPQAGKALHGTLAGPAVGAAPPSGGPEVDPMLDDMSDLTPPAEISCPQCGAQIPIQVGESPEAEPAPDLGNLGGESADDVD